MPHPHKLSNGMNDERVMQKHQHKIKLLKHALVLSMNGE